MQTRPACTVAQLLFARPPRLDFAMLVADLEAAFRNCPEEGRHLHWDHDDLAILDVQGSRIIIGLDATLTGDHRACLTLGVGHGPGEGEPGLARRQDTVSQMIAERIARICPPDAVIWHHSARALTPDLLDALIAELPTTSTDRMARDLTRREEMARLRQGLDARRVTAPAANDMPSLPDPQLQELARVRAALLGGPQAPSPALRLAAHAVNASLVCIALPVGAAMVTWSLLRGENLNASARLMAVIGIAIGARDAAVAQDLFPLV